MDIEIIDNLIEQYKKEFNRINQMEIYKWQAVKIFQDNWDINSNDFYSMLDKSLEGTQNLLVSGNYFPKLMLLKNTEKTPEKIRNLFYNLYDEKKVHNPMNVATLSDFMLPLFYYLLFINVVIYKAAT